jgi:hypothetical protein
MNKSKIYFPIYILSASILISSIVYANNAVSAPNSISIKEFKAMQSKVQKLTAQISSLNTSSNSVLVPEGYSDLLGYECGRAGSYEREFAIGGKRFFQCRFNFVVSGQ